MKKTIVILFLLFTVNSFAQKDTTVKEKTIVFKESELAPVYNNIALIQQGIQRSAALNGEQVYQLIQLLETFKKEIEDKAKIKK